MLINLKDVAPECDKRCRYCLESEHWVPIDMEETDYGTCIYTYECRYEIYDEDLGDTYTCKGTTKIEVDEKESAAERARELREDR